ncbi:MAG: DUF4276 family protein [Prevotella sp.]|nr:DUF4276 family protein [Prevotella sp.]
MKRLIIVCEGATEQEFCQTVLTPYFYQKDILVETPTIKHSCGGIVAWGTLKKQLVQHLNETDVIVTMLIDFYRIKDSFRFPGWMESKKIGPLQAKTEFLFRQIAMDMQSDLQNRFVPYIQMHEFEGLLFSDISVFKNNFRKGECDFEAIEDAIKGFNTPEEINNGPNTAPSVRLKNAIQGYNKELYGSILADDIGLETIRKRCPLFNQWIERLESALSIG